MGSSKCGDPNNIKTEYDVHAGHGIITKSYGNECSTSNSPYINNCGLHVAGRILGQIYGLLKQPGTASKESLAAFDQTMFFVGGDDAQMDQRGRVYFKNRFARSMSETEMEITSSFMSMLCSLGASISAFPRNSGLSISS